MAFLLTGCRLPDWYQVLVSPADNIGGIASLFLLCTGGLLVTFGIAGAAARGHEDHDGGELGILLIGVASIIGLVSFGGLFVGAVMCGMGCCSGSGPGDAVMSVSLIGVGVSFLSACSGYASIRGNFFNSDKSDQNENSEGR